MNKFQSSWELVKASARVLRSDKELVIFPIISAVCAFLVILAFFVPMIALNFGDMMVEGATGVLFYVGLFFFYIVQYFVIFFCNTALVGAALIRLRGGDPTLGDGFRIAFQRIFPILGYALISATVGMILRLISERSGWVGRLIISIVGFVWNVGTFLVVPILAAEDVGPIEAIKRSVTNLKKTWGEQLIGNFGIGTVFGIIALVMIILLIPLLFLVFSVSESLWPLGILAVVYVIAFTVLGLLQSALNGIYTAAVYQYASNGQISEGFSPELIQNAFRSR